MAGTARTYWFRAKRYGWGWGLPVTWQGWAAMVAFVALFGAGFLVFPAKTETGPLLIHVFVLVAALVAVCWLKGEPPRWRWGDRERA